MRYAIIKNSEVINVIEANEETAAIVADSTEAIAVQSDVAGIGQQYINGVFIRPESPTVTAFRAELQTYIDSLNAKTEYDGLGLSITDTPAEAMLKLKTKGVSWSECCTLDMLKRNLKDAESIG